MGLEARRGQSKVHHPTGGNPSGNPQTIPIDLAELLAFDTAALRIAPRHDVAAVEIWISDASRRPTVVVLGARQALAAAALLTAAVASLEPEGGQ
jgi:hypothetical protein